MYFKQFLHDETGCASYFLASRSSREAVVVDPQLDIEPYIELANERGYRIIGVIDTHLHADHISGNRKLAAAVSAKLYMHESADVAFEFDRLADGDTVHVGQIQLEVVHTPGHRPEAISLLVSNTARTPETSLVLSGDTLFVGDVGRPDFGGPEGAAAQYESTQRLLALADWVGVFPAHFEGSCGKGMCGRPSSTIGFERRFNPVLQLSHEDFLERTGETPARPLNMTAILATNCGREELDWAMPADRAPAPDVSVDAAPDWIEQKSPLILDVREPSEFGGAHIPGAVSLPQADLATRLNEVPKDREILVMCRSGRRSAAAAKFLLQMGYPQVSNLEGGIIAWESAGHPVAS